MRSLPGALAEPRSARRISPVVFLKTVQLREALDVDGQEEVPDRDGDVLALGVLASQLLQEGPLGQGRRQDLHHGGEAVALVAAGLLAQSADGRERGVL